MLSLVAGALFQIDKKSTHCVKSMNSFYAEVNGTRKICEY